MKKLINITSLIALTICCLFCQSIRAYQIIFINYSNTPLEVCKIFNIAHPRRLPADTNYLVLIDGQPYGKLYPDNIQGWRLCKGNLQTLEP